MPVLGVGRSIPAAQVAGVSPCLQLPWDAGMLDGGGKPGAVLLLF